MPLAVIGQLLQTVIPLNLSELAPVCVSSNQCQTEAYLSLLELLRHSDHTRLMTALVTVIKAELHEGQKGMHSA